MSIPEWLASAAAAVLAVVVGYITTVLKNKQKESDLRLQQLQDSIKKQEDVIAEALKLKTAYDTAKLLAIKDISKDESITKENSKITEKEDDSE